MRYRAFFSYSRQDDRIARWLHSELEGFRAPESFKGPDGKRLKLQPVFRDRTDLSGGGELSKRIADTLAMSDNLIVLCSPAAAASVWVNREVETFIEQGYGDRIFPVIAAGLPESADVELDFFPPALRQRGVLAADLREITLPNGKMVGDGREGGRLKLIAGLLGVDLDKLTQRERQRQRRLVVMLATASFAFAGLAAAAGGLGWLAYQQSNENARLAEQERTARQQAEEQSGVIARQNDDLKSYLLHTFVERARTGEGQSGSLSISDSIAEASPGQIRSDGSEGLLAPDDINASSLERRGRYALAGWRLATELTTPAEDLRRELRGALAEVMTLADESRSPPGAPPPSSSIAWPTFTITPELNRAELKRDGQTIGMKLEVKIRMNEELMRTEMGILLEFDDRDPVRLSGHMSWIGDVSLSKDATAAVTVGGDKTARVWRLADGAKLGEMMHEGEGHFTTATFDASGAVVFTGAFDGELKAWNAATGDLIVAMHKFDKRIVSIVAPDDGSPLLVRLADDSVRLAPVQRFLQPAATLVLEACRDLLSPAERRFRSYEVTDELLQKFWIVSPGQDRDVCEGVEGLPAFGEPPKIKSLHDVVAENPDVF